MATDPLTSSSVNCDDCALIAREHTDPLKVLSRLPRSLFNMRRPTEVETPGATQVERRQRRRPSFRIREGVLNRQAHVCDTELGDHRSVHQLDHRVHD